MRIATKDIIFAGQELLLTNQRALFWPARSSLVLSDLHLGKAAHFRKHGIAVPSSVNERDMLRLDTLIRYFRPENVVFVGDLFHAKVNSEVAKFKQLSSAHIGTKFILVQGNHDVLAPELLQDIGISSIESALRMENLLFVHELGPFDQAAIGGHVHPGVSIRLPDKKIIRLPCFVVTEQRIILPAFSLFTGLDTSYRHEQATYYAFDDKDLYAF